MATDEQIATAFNAGHRLQKFDPDKAMATAEIKTTATSF
jgi:hypothetical protein